MTTLNNFKFGSNIVLFESPIYNLKTLIKRRRNGSIKHFKTYQDLFELTFTKLDDSKNSFGLNFDKINFLENIVESFFEKIIGLYKSLDERDNLNFQIDLTLGVCNNFFLLIFLLIFLREGTCFKTPHT